MTVLKDHIGRFLLGDSSRNISWTFLGGVIHAAAQWGILVLLAKFGSSEVVGEYALALAITSPIVLFLGLQLRTVIATDMNYQYSLCSYFNLRGQSGVASLTLIAFSCFWLSSTDNLSISIILIGLAKVLESYSDIIYGHLQRLSRLDLIGKSYALRGAALAFSVALVQLVTVNLAWICTTICVVYFLCFYYVDRRALKANMRPSQDDLPCERHESGKNTEWTAIARISMPLAFACLLSALYVNIPRYFVQIFEGTATLGVFSAASSVVIISNTLINAISQTFLPILAADYISNRRLYLWRTLVLAFGGGLLGMLGFIAAYFWGKEILSILFTPDYGNYTSLFSVLFGGVGFLYVFWFLVAAIQAARGFKDELVIRIAGSIVLVSACWFLGSWYGAIGIAWAIGLTNVILAVIATWTFAILLKRAPA